MVKHMHVVAWKLIFHSIGFFYRFFYVCPEYQIPKGFFFQMNTWVIFFLHKSFEISN